MSCVELCELCELREPILVKFIHSSDYCNCKQLTQLIISDYYCDSVGGLGLSYQATGWHKLHIAAKQLWRILPIYEDFCGLKGRREGKPLEVKRLSSVLNPQSSLLNTLLSTQS